MTTFRRPRSARSCAGRWPSWPRSTAASTSSTRRRAGEQDHRAVARDRQDRLPRHQHPRGVRRRGRRHQRPRRRVRGARRAGLPAAADGRLARRSAARSSPATAPRSRSSAGCRASATAPARWRSRSPSRTPAPTPTTSPPSARRTATSGCSTGARSSSPASTRPTTCWSWRAPRTRDRQGSSRCLFVVPTDAAGFEAKPIPMEIVSPEKQFQVFIDDVRLPARRAGRRRGRRAGAALRGAQPRADHGRVVLDRAGPLRARQGGGVRQGAHGLPGADRRPPGDRAPAGRRATSRSSSPG